MPLAKTLTLAACCALLGQLGGAATGSAGRGGDTVARAAGASWLNVGPALHPSWLVRFAHVRAETGGTPATPDRRTAPAAAPSTVTPNDPEWPQQWSLAQIGAPAAWAAAPVKRQVIVAVVDSGVDPTQPDLQGALVPGADFADGSGSTDDQYGHGTMVAGVIAARGDNGQGVAGACWTCLIMPIKVLGADGSGTGSSIAAGIRYAADHGAQVINLSIILSGPDDDVEAAIAYAHDRGVLVVSAAGNSGGDAATYPASFPDVLSVAGSDDQGQLYSWSTRGAWVTLAAPGCTVTTALGGQYAGFCGTSAAAPLVAGLAGLALESGSVSGADVAAALTQSAAPLTGGGVAAGRVNAAGLFDDLVAGKTKGPPERALRLITGFGSRAIAG